MTPVFQTTSTNCLRACIASLLDIGIDEVTIACDGAPEHWDWVMFQSWLAEQFQLQAIEVLVSGKPVFAAPAAPVLCVLTFEAPQEPVTGKHAVVGEFIGTEGFRLLHDPHRSGDGPTGELYAVMFLTPISPLTQGATDDSSRAASCY